MKLISVIYNKNTEKTLNSTRGKLLQIFTLANNVFNANNQIFQIDLKNSRNKFLLTLSVQFYKILSIYKLCMINERGRFHGLHASHAYCC